MSPSPAATATTDANPRAGGSSIDMKQGLDRAARSPIEVVGGTPFDRSSLSPYFVTDPEDVDRCLSDAGRGRGPRTAMPRGALE